MNFFVAEQPVLFVDDDESVLGANVQSLELAGISVRPFRSAAQALAEIGSDYPGIVVTDIRMPRMDGLQLFARIRDIDPEIPVILITGHADVPTAVAALHEGAFDFLAKPFAADHLVASARRALATRRLVIDNRRLRAAAVDNDPSPLIGDSPGIRALRDTIAQVAPADIDVLVEGETGSGKELVASLLHSQGPRRGRPFVPVNCGALPEDLAEPELFGQAGAAGPESRFSKPGRIVASSGGTLFLDDIELMPARIQALMLRVLEEREVMAVGGETPRVVDLRVVAASKLDLAAESAEGRFRLDLFYRLNVVRLRIPPLRERRSDIPMLFAHFVEAAQNQVRDSRFRMTDSIRRHLLEHDWPGNVRELRNFAFRAVCGLPAQGSGDSNDPAPPLARRVERFEAAILRETLAATAGDVAAAIEILGIPRKTFYDKLGRHSIRPQDFRRAQRSGVRARRAPGDDRKDWPE